MNTTTTTTTTTTIKHPVIVLFIRYECYFPVFYNEQKQHASDYFNRNKLIIKYLHMYFNKKTTKEKNGILVISENEEHLINLQKNFSDDICTFVMENRFKRKEILFELNQKRELVFATYDNLLNPLFSNKLGYINVVFFLTSQPVSIGISIVNKIISCKENKERLIIMDLVNSFQDQNIRKKHYQEYKEDIKIITRMN